MKMVKCRSYHNSDTDSEIEVLLNTEESHVRYGGVSSSDVSVPSAVPDFKDQSRCQKVWSVLSSLTIEPVMFASMFGCMMNSSVLSNMIMDKGCLYIYRYSADVCRNLSGHKAEKDNVEMLAANYSVYGNLLSFVAAFLMVFIAPWSDKYGRKLPLLLVIFGIFLTDAGYIYCTIYYESDLFYIILSRLSTEMFGGFICFMTIMFSLASELSTPRNRSLKYTSLEVSLGVGMSLGGLAGGFVYKYYGYLYVYMAAALCHFFGCLWVVFFVQETRGLDVQMTWREKAKDFFVLTSVYENVSATFRERRGNARCLLLLLMLCMCLIVLNYESFGTIAYVYVHHVYNWDPTMYNIVTTTSMMVGYTFTIILVPVFIRVLNCNDFTLGIIGTVSMMAKNYLIAFSWSNVYVYYAGLTVGIFNGLSTLSIRTGISKLVDSDEVARVFSLLATCEAILPMVGSIVVTEIFERTMDTYPNVTYSLTVFWLTIPLVTFIWALEKSRTPISSLNLQSTGRWREKN